MIRRVVLLGLVAGVALTLVLTGCSAGSVAPSRSAAPGSTRSAAPSAAPTPTAALTGCALVTQAEASAATGATFPAGKENSFTLTDKIVAHTGCGYQDGPHALGYDLNTLASTIPIAQMDAAAWGALQANGATTSTFGGNPGVLFVKGPLQEAAFSHGQVSVVVSIVNAKDGAATAIANLIASRM
jgi:hypothetical protein